jgi:hypothetical protein
MNKLPFWQRVNQWIEDHDNAIFYTLVTLGLIAAVVWAVAKIALVVIGN